MSKPKKTLIFLILVLLSLTGFIDTSPTYTVEELDERYGTAIQNLGYYYKKQHHYSLLNHKKVEYVFRGTKQYSHYFVIVVRAADDESYISRNRIVVIRKTLPLTVKGHDTEIMIYDTQNAGAAAECAVKLKNGCIKVYIATNDNRDIEGYWQSDPISDDAYRKIFEDLLLTILK